LSITIKTSTGPACSLLSPIHSPQWKNPAKDWLEIEGIIKKIPISPVDAIAGNLISSGDLCSISLIIKLPLRAADRFF
jgi:hypothetical protein